VALTLFKTQSAPAVTRAAFQLYLWTPLPPHYAPAKMFVYLLLSFSAGINSVAVTVEGKYVYFTQNHSATKNKP
jgi:hypothetical protein